MSPNEECCGKKVREGEKRGDIQSMANDGVLVQEVRFYFKRAKESGAHAHENKSGRILKIRSSSINGQ